MLSYRRSRDRAAGCIIVFAKSRRLGLGVGDNILRTLWVYLHPLWYNRFENLSNSVKKLKIRLLQRSRSFKAIEIGTNRNPVCGFLLVINSNWHPISYRFGVIAAYCSNFPPTRSFWLKILGRRGRLPPIIFARIVRPMNALQLCRWQFSHMCYTAEALRAKIDRKSFISHQRGQFDPKFQVEGVAPINQTTDRQTDGRRHTFTFANNGHPHPRKPQNSENFAL